MEMQHPGDEQGLLLLLQEMQKQLTTAINSLGENAPPPSSAESMYLQWVAVSVNRAADGYLVLREAHRVDSSKLLIRPMLEAIFAGTAVMKQPGFLTRRAYSEWKEELKMFPSMTPAQKAATEKEFEDFKTEFLKSHPGYKFDQREARVWDSAVAAGMEKHYNTAYRIYCKFTHGALGAVAGALNELTDAIDTQIVISCVFYALELLKTHTPATVPDLADLRSRLPFGV